MKKLLLVLFPLILFSSITHTQRADNTNAAAYNNAKAALKQKEKQDITEALKEAGVPGETIAQFMLVHDEYSKKNTMVKQNASLSAGKKEKQTLANNKEKDKKLKELIGETKYNVYTEVRRTQKEAEALAVNTINQ